ncbi:hypothetical protein G5V59_02695 [Nocardioides sp. W3-2-3]|nr:hypothetical protein [Nocardioides convexus]NGZ99660.1 hypothetical protein [Nocardioides convexus]
MCDHHLADDPTGLPCTRTDPHTPGRGCTYISTSATDDRHTEGGHG